MKLPGYTTWLIDSNGVAQAPTAVRSSNGVCLKVAATATVGATLFTSLPSTSTKAAQLSPRASGTSAFSSYSKQVPRPTGAVLSDETLFTQIKTSAGKLAARAKPMPDDLSQAIDDHLFDLL